MIDTDGAVHALEGKHCRQIVHVVRMLCGATQTMSDRQEAEAIIGTFMQGADAVEGHTTYGTSGQRYEAAVALRHVVDEVTGRPIGAPRYVIDANTGEFVIGVSDLQDAATSARASRAAGLMGAWRTPSGRESRCRAMASRAAPAGRDHTSGATRTAAIFAQTMPKKR